MASTSYDLIKRMSDPGYRRWVLLQEGLRCVKLGLEDMTGAAMRDFHSWLVGKHSGEKCTRCTNESIVKAGDTWSISCPRCQGWMQDILEHADYKELHWNNSYIRLWPVNHWEVAKLYMERQRRGNSSPASSDVAALLTLMMNCKVFRKQENVDCTKARKVCLLFWFII